MITPPQTYLFFFFNDTATTEIYTLSLHDALPIFGYKGKTSGGLSYDVSGTTAQNSLAVSLRDTINPSLGPLSPKNFYEDRKSTRLNSSHDQISYAVFCLKKKNHPNSIERMLYRAR